MALTGFGKQPPVAQAAYRSDPATHVVTGGLGADALVNEEASSHAQHVGVHE